MEQGNTFSKGIRLFSRMAASSSTVPGGAVNPTFRPKTISAIVHKPVIYTNSLVSVIGILPTPKLEISRKQYS